MRTKTKNRNYQCVIKAASLMMFLFAGQERDSHAGCEDTAGPGVVWSFCDMAGADLAGPNLCGAILDNANLSNANLTNADLSGADLSNANLTAVVGLSSSQLSSAGKIMGIDLSNQALAGFDLSGKDLAYANLSFANFSNADLSNANLANANLSYADLSNADLGSASLTNANLSYADLNNADVSNADLTGADLSYANLMDATGFTSPQPGIAASNITGAGLSGPDTGSTSVSNANLTNAVPAGPGGILLPPPAGGEAPNNEQTTAEEKQAEDDQAKQTGSHLPEPEITAEGTESASPPGPGSRRKVLSLKSILERFREFRGKPSMKAYLSLFVRQEGSGFRQEPPVLLSDGRKDIRVSFLSVPGDRNVFDVALMGARLVSMKRDPEYTNTWIVDVNPEKSGYAASMTVSQDRYMMVYPLTVAPPVNIDLDRSGAVSDDDFALFLRERGTPNQPKFDLNRDGKRDPLDDYIFTANYLVLRGTAKGDDRKRPR